MENRELINNLMQREEYLQDEWYHLYDLANEMGGLVALQDSDPRDAKDLLEAFTAVRKALKAIRRIIGRNK